VEHMDLAETVTLFQGAALTILLSSAGILLGLPLGLAMALIRWRHIPILSPVVSAYVSIVRATPLVMFVLLIFFSMPTFGIEIGPVPAAVLALTLNTAAFNCEIWRGGLIDFSKGQLDAAQAFGMRPSVAFLRIVLPQLWRACLPGLVNEMSLLIKGSPAVAVVGLVDLTRAAVRIGATTYEPVPPFLAAIFFYVIILLPLILLQRMIERYSFRLQWTA
jgi:His/Glu/Gln/Arg/opine family amino acid ABC transporter permease subunit